MSHRLILKVRCDTVLLLWTSAVLFGLREKRMKESNRERAWLLRFHR